MGLLNKLLGYRWSLYVVRNENELIYAMHEHSVIELIDWVMVKYFENGLSPVEPWSLYLNFNKNHKKIKLMPQHFSGLKISDELMDTISAIDPGWDVKAGKPVFMEAATKKVLKISEYMPGEEMDLQAMMDNINKPKDPTFYSVMDEVFGDK
jgi:hypothetical protein